MAATPHSLALRCAAKVGTRASERVRAREPVAVSLLERARRSVEELRRTPAKAVELLRRRVAPTHNRRN
eukprot:1053532-Pleurochrysis_carterae.AAC.4